MKLLLVTVFLFATIFQLCENYKILGVFPLPVKSHMTMYQSLMKGLAGKGHEVDVLSHFPLKNPIPRYNDISVLGSIPLFVNNFTVQFAREAHGNHYKTIKFALFEENVKTCRAVLNSPAAKELLNSNKKYDLVIMEVCYTDCMVGFAHHFQVPVIGITSSVDVPWGGIRIGNPDNPSYIPHFFVPYLSRMNLIERLINTASLLGMKLGFELSHQYVSDVSREFFGPNLPNIEDLIRNTSLMFVNSHVSINAARSTVPNFIEVGGLHIQPPKGLSKHFEDSLTIKSQYKGVIYFSTGSQLLSETFDSHKLQALFDAFKELPYKVLWKAVKQNMPKDLVFPSNIQFEPWMPQMDILCHPNVKLFVTHGGLMGTQEAVHCAVPRLGIPFLGDQALNLKASEAMGLAIVVEYDDITKENIFNAAKALLEDPKYKNNAERVSKLFRDRPLSAMDTAIYWTEYVIRHNGAPHLRSVGADLSWYQYYLVDVGAILITILVTFILIIYYSIRYILCSLIFRRTISKTKPKKD